MPDPSTAGGAAPATALASQDDIFRQLVENVQEYAIFLLNPAGIITTWNAGAQAIKG